MHARVGRVADLDIADGADIEVGEFLCPAFRHEDAGQREADLSGDRHGIDHQARQRRREIGIVEQDGGGLASEFEADAGQSLGAGGSDVASRRRRAREGHLVDGRMADQMVADLPSCRDEVEDARRQPGGLDRLREDIGFERGFRGGLGDERAPGCEPGGDLVAQEHHGRVPGGDRRADADRLLDDPGSAAAGPRALLLEGIGIAVDEIGVEIEKLRILADELGGYHDRRADLHRPGTGDLVQPAPQVLRHLSQIAGALTRRHPWPGPLVERFAGGRDREMDILNRGLGIAQDGFFGDRRDHVERGRRAGCDPLAADKEFFRGAKGRSGCGHDIHACSSSGRHRSSGTENVSSRFPTAGHGRPLRLPHVFILLSVTPSRNGEKRFIFA